MRLRELVCLNPEMLHEALAEVTISTELGPEGGDKAYTCPPCSAVHLLMDCIERAVARRVEQYGPGIALPHAVQLSFRIGAAYGRRVPDVTDPAEAGPMPAKLRAHNIANLLKRDCPAEVLRHLMVELARSRSQE